MQFTPGNQLWKLRSKHGRGYFFKSPEAMWDAACTYFQWCDEHPVNHVVRGTSTQPVITLPKLHAYTLVGLCSHLGCGDKYFNHFEASLVGKNDELSEEFLTIINLIRNIIYEQKFTAAAAGELNPALIARELNLAYNAAIAHKNDTGTGQQDKEGTVIVWGNYEIPV